MSDERKVGGLWCSDVLAHISDYLDKDLPKETLERVEQHLAGCNQCERFGSELVTTLETLRKHLRNPT